MKDEEAEAERAKGAQAVADAVAEHLPQATE